MIVVSQGFEQGIGLPLFAQAMASLPAQERGQFKLFCFESTWRQVLASLNLPSRGVKKLKLHFLDPHEGPTQTTAALQQACHTCSEEGAILLTLPSAKSQIYFGPAIVSGHTDYLRQRFNQEYLAMVFLFRHCALMVLTDHIPLNQVTQKINQTLMEKKLSCALNGLQQFFTSPQKILFSGINPHCGEAGLLGNEDDIIREFVSKNKNFFHTQVSGPYAGDSLFYQCGKNSLLVYAYHDQGLAAFKARYGLYGLNATLGLPFLRVSPDFGIGSSIANLQEAHYGSMFHLVKTLLKH